MPGSRNVNTDRKRYRIQLTGCPGSVGSDLEMPAAEQPQDSPSPGRSDWGRTLALAVIVALCAGLVSGSCTGLVTWWDEAAIVAAGISAGVALVVASVLFFLLKPNRRGIWRFAIICVAGYLAAAFLAWALFIVGIGAVAVGRSHRRGRRGRSHCGREVVGARQFRRRRAHYQNYGPHIRHSHRYIRSCRRVGFLC